jgi:hypothetical protein
MYVFLQSYEGLGKTFESFPEMVGKEKLGTSEKSPFLLPSLLIREHLRTRLSSLDEKQDQIYVLEQTMGIRIDQSMQVDIRSLNFSSMTRELNGLNSNLAWTLHSCRRTKRLLEFMDSIAAKYRSKAIANGYSECEAVEVEQMLLDAHAYLRSWNNGLSDRIEYLSKRVQALSQSVRPVYQVRDILLILLAPGIQRYRST